MRVLFLNVLGVGLAVAALSGIRLGAQGNPEAAKLQNPVASTAESLAAGKALYQRFCANCHGSNAEGGPGNDLIPPAPDLTGKEWKHGSTAGEIFNSIKKGTPPEFNMAAFGEQGLKDQVVWNVVNYVRSLSEKVASVIWPGRHGQSSKQLSSSHARPL